ncbi:MAG: Rieske (2Fe-2S) protein [Planctomycetota bacterium]|nr:MAG: Rieske (2Fe-2S) protein [Planctomycetota bacterium]
MNDGDPELHTVPPNRRFDERQPQWRTDFPIDWPQDHYVARRDFTKFLCLTSFAFAVGQFTIAYQNWRRRRRGEPPIVKIADKGQLSIGAALVFHYPDEAEPCLLLRTGEDSFHAYSQKCTHLACAVTPQFDDDRLLCPCHKGYFDMSTGRPLAGPPRRPLPRITLKFRGDQIFAAGIERSTA